MIGLIVILFFCKKLQIYNHIQPPDAANAPHGGNNLQPRHIFYYEEYIYFFRGLTLRHMCISNKNIKTIFQINGIIHPNTTE